MDVAVLSLKHSLGGSNYKLRATMYTVRGVRAALWKWQKIK
jgi:hypothetical protein